MDKEHLEECAMGRKMKIASVIVFVLFVWLLLIVADLAIMPPSNQSLVFLIQTIIALFTIFFLIFVLRIGRQNTIHAVRKPKRRNRTWDWLEPPRR